jgi:hypothetical protein
MRGARLIHENVVLRLGGVGLPVGFAELRLADRKALGLYRGGRASRPYFSGRKTRTFRRHMHTERKVPHVFRFPVRL